MLRPKTPWYLQSSLKSLKVLGAPKKSGKYLSVILFVGTKLMWQLGEENPLHWKGFVAHLSDTRFYVQSLQLYHMQLLPNKLSKLVAVPDQTHLSMNLKGIQRAMPAMMDWVGSSLGPRGFFEVPTSGFSQQSHGGKSSIWWLKVWAGKTPIRQTKVIE